MEPPPPQKTLENNNKNSNNKSFSHDINQMPDCPPRNPRHRRAHSEILRLPDDLSFDIVGPTDDSDNYNFNDNDNEEEDILAMYLDMNKIDGGGQNGQEYNIINNNVNSGGASGSTRVRHQHSQSMDGSEMLMGSGSVGPGSLAEAKKSMSDAKLADLALVDPKRAKRIWANRQSAARSKERKMRYIGELERKVQTLQTESTTLSAQLSMLQRDTSGLTAENSELKMRVQTMEQQVHLQDAVNDALREEVQRLKLATGQMMQNGPMMNFGQSSFGGSQQFHNHQQHHNRNHNQAMQSLLAAQQLQQLQIRPQHQQQLHQNQHYQQQQQMRRTISPQNQRENNNASME